MPPPLLAMAPRQTLKPYLKPSNPVGRLKNSPPTTSSLKTISSTKPKRSCANTNEPPSLSCNVAYASATLALPATAPSSQSVVLSAVPTPLAVAVPAKSSTSPTPPPAPKGATEVAKAVPWLMKSRILSPRRRLAKKLSRNKKQQVDRLTIVLAKVTWKNEINVVIRKSSGKAFQQGD